MRIQFKLIKPSISSAAPEAPPAPTKPDTKPDEKPEVVVSEADHVGALKALEKMLELS